MKHEAATGEARWELTPLQEAVINLRESRDPPLAFADIGEQLAMNAKQVGPLLKEAQQKRAHIDSREPLHEREPGVVAAGIDKATELEVPWKAFEKFPGVNKMVIRKLKVLFENEYRPVVQKLRAVKNDVLIKMVEDRMMQVLEALDGDKILDARPRDLGILFGILTEKRQLLKNLPTQILSREETKHINILITDMTKEAHRRGMTLEHNPVTLEGQIVEEHPGTNQIMNPET